MAVIQSQEKLLEVEDILTEVMAYLPNVDLMSCGQVCQVWERLSMPLLWRTLPDLLPLIKLLGDVHESNPIVGFLCLDKTRLVAFTDTCSFERCFKRFLSPPNTGVDLPDMPTLFARLTFRSLTVLKPPIPTPCTIARSSNCCSSLSPKGPTQFFRS